MSECVKHEGLGEHKGAAEQCRVPAHCRVIGPGGAQLPPASRSPASFKQQHPRWKCFAHEDCAAWENSLFQVIPENQLAFRKHQKLSVCKTGASAHFVLETFLVGRSLFMGRCKILLNVLLHFWVKNVDFVIKQFYEVDVLDWKNPKENIFETATMFHGIALTYKHKHTLVFPVWQNVDKQFPLGLIGAVCLKLLPC